MRTSLASQKIKLTSSTARRNWLDLSEAFACELGTSCQCLRDAAMRIDRRVGRCSKRQLKRLQIRGEYSCFQSKTSNHNRHPDCTGPPYEADSCSSHGHLTGRVSSSPRSDSPRASVLQSRGRAGERRIMRSSLQYPADWRQEGVGCRRPRQDDRSPPTSEESDSGVPSAAKWTIVRCDDRLALIRLLRWCACDPALTTGMHPSSEWIPAGDKNYLPRPDSIRHQQLLVNAKHRFLLRSRTL